MDQVNGINRNQYPRPEKKPMRTEVTLEKLMGSPKKSIPEAAMGSSTGDEDQGRAKREQHHQQWEGGRERAISTG